MKVWVICKDLEAGRRRIEQLGIKVLYTFAERNYLHVQADEPTLLELLRDPNFITFHKEQPVKALQRREGRKRG